MKALAALAALLALSACEGFTPYYAMTPEERAAYNTANAPYMAAMLAQQSSMWAQYQPPLHCVYGSSLGHPDVTCNR